MTNKIQPSTTRKSDMKKIVAVVTLGLAALLPLLSFANTYADWQLESDVIFNSAFERDFSPNDYLYIKPSYLPPGQPSGITNTSTLYNVLLRDGKSLVPKPNPIPIAGEITIFVPQYKPGMRLGDAYVERLFILDQIANLLGSHVIDKFRFGDQNEQINALFSRARDYANLHGKVLGEPLDPAVDPQNDMIWPEYRTVHGQRVLVPIVYLTDETLSNFIVGNHRAHFDGTDTQLGSITVGQSAAVLLRSEYVQISDNLYLEGALNVTEKNKEIVVGGAFEANGGTVRAEQDLMLAAQSILLRPSINIKRSKYGQAHVIGELTSITAGGKVVLRSYGDLAVVASTVEANAITLAADGDIYVGTQTLQSVWSGPEMGWDVDRSTIDYIGSKLTAEESIELLAAGQIQIEASEIVSSAGHIEILAQLGIVIKDKLSEHQESMSGKFKKTTKNIEAYKTFAMRSIIDAGEGVVIKSEAGDIELRAVAINSSAGAHVSAAQGKVNLLMTTETDHYNYHSVRENLLTTKTKTYGYHKETGIPNTIIGGLKVEALTGLQVQYPGDPEATFEEQLGALNVMPGMEWISDLEASGLDIDWAAAKNNYDSWNKTDRNLSPAAIALLTIVVAAVAGPGAGALGELAAGAVATGATSTAVVSAAVTAGVTSLAVQSSVIMANAAVNGETDLYEIQKDIFSEETAISVATAMVTASVLAYVDSTFFQEIDTQALADSQNIDLANVDTGWLRNAEGQLNLAGQASQIVVESAVSSAVEVLAKGNSLSDFGHDFHNTFEDNLRLNVVNKVGEATYTAIQGAADFNTAVEYIALAGAGCMVGAASDTSSNTENSCYSGAGGAVIGKFVGDQLSQDEATPEKVEELKNRQEVWLSENGIQSIEDLALLQDTNPDQYASLSTSFDRNRLANIRRLHADGINISRLSAGLLAMVSGGNVDVATNQASAVLENNVTLGQMYAVLDAVNVLADYQSLAPLMQLQDDLIGAVTEGEVENALSLFIEENPGYKHLEELTTDEALQFLFEFASNAGYSAEFTGLLDIRYRRLSLTSGVVDIDDLLMDVADYSSNSVESYFELRAAAKDPDAMDDIRDAIDRRFAQRYGVSDCGLVGACVEASALFKAALLMSGAELTSEAERYYQENRPKIIATGDADLLMAFDSTFGYFSTASEVVVDIGSGVKDTSEAAVSAISILTGMVQYTISPSAEAELDYSYGVAKALELRVLGQYVASNWDMLPGSLKREWTDYQAEIEAAEAEGNHLLASKLRSKQYYVASTIVLPFVRASGNIEIDFLDVNSATRRFWTTSTIYSGIKVFQRNDIFDPNLMTTWVDSGVTVQGTNIERMATGRAPIGHDMKSVNLHHMTQRNDSGIAEMTQTFHQQNSGVIHINPNTIPSGIDRAQFDAWKRNYWKTRSEDF